MSQVPGTASAEMASEQPATDRKRSGVPCSPGWPVLAWAPLRPPWSAGPGEWHIGDPPGKGA